MSYVTVLLRNSLLVTRVQTINKEMKLVSDSFDPLLVLLLLCLSLLFVKL